MKLTKSQLEKLIREELNSMNIYESSNMATSYVKSASNNSYVNAVTFKDTLSPLAQELDTYSKRGYGDLEYSAKTVALFKRLVDSMSVDHKEAEKYQ
jgi:hypothetical protein